MNLYLYGDNDPVNHGDPAGLLFDLMGLLGVSGPATATPIRRKLSAARRGRLTTLQRLSEGAHSKQISPLIPSPS